MLSLIFLLSDLSDLENQLAANTNPGISLHKKEVYYDVQYY